MTADGQVLPSIILSDRKVYNLTLQGIDANRDVVLNLPGTSTGASVFDNTFDFTFHALTNVAANVRLLVDECTDGIYLRWINRHGFYCYWLFKRGDESKQIANDGEFIRNNMQDYNYVNGYHGGSGRKQRKTEENALLVCAPLVDSETFDFLFQLALSPIVDMYAGKNVNGVDSWKAVNVSVGNFNKTKAVLQDFVATTISPINKSTKLMRNDMLFIGDKLMDLDDDTKVTLNFKSNIFTDLSKIISNNSYTIKLPNTIRNQCAIMHADLPSCDIVYPRIKLNARYFRNGIDILNNATAVLLSTSDVFEFALSWVCPQICKYYKWK